MTTGRINQVTISVRAAGFEECANPEDSEESQGLRISTRPPRKRSSNLSIAARFKYVTFLHFLSMNVMPQNCERMTLLSFPTATLQQLHRNSMPCSRPSVREAAARIVKCLSQLETLIILDLVIAKFNCSCQEQTATTSHSKINSTRIPPLAIQHPFNPCSRPLLFRPCSLYPNSLRRN
jgi:hypothetical protein